MLARRDLDMQVWNMFHPGLRTILGTLNAETVVNATLSVSDVKNVMDNFENWELECGHNAHRLSGTHISP